jgi:hypothetical protein
MGEDRCSFCRSPRALYGCSPGRCLGRHSGTDVASPKQDAPARPPAPPLGPKRLVLTATLRSGPNGAAFWLMELECGHQLWRYAGKSARRTPKTDTCVGCGSPTNVLCMGGCGAVADLPTRAEAWAFFRGAWFCIDCLRRLLLTAGQ